MNISLTPTLEEMVNEKVASGLYNSASEVIREALRLLYERDEYQRKRLEELNREIEKGLACLARGEVKDGSVVMEELRQDMQNSYIITKDAENDLLEIGDFIALDNPNASLDLMDKFEECFEHIVSMPKIGYKKSEWTNKDVRFFTIKKYLIVYQTDNENIVILRVLSSFRDVTSILAS